MKRLAAHEYLDMHTHDCRPADNCLKICNLIAGVDPVEYVQGQWYSLGIHPWYANRPEEKLKVLEYHAADPAVIALGESGMDKLKGPEKALQEQLFRKHIDLSGQLGKPLVIHCVKRYNELRRIRKQSRAVVPWIVHGFSGHPELATQLTEAGMYLSFGYMATFRENKAYRSLCSVPDNYLFLETDSAPGLDIEEMYRFAAAEREMELQQLKEQINNNFRRVFQYGEV